MKRPALLLLAAALTLAGCAEQRASLKNTFVGILDENEEQ